MQKFQCEHCNYETSYQTNFTRHNKSRKHAEKIMQCDTEKYICSECGKLFLYRQGLFKHKKICDQNTPNQRIDDLKTEIEKLKMQNMQDQIKNLQDKVELLSGFKNIAENATETSKSSCSALNYIIKHYNDAPCIKTFTNFELLTEGNEDYSIAEIVIHKYNHDELCTYIGDIIVNEYKTTDPKRQTFWISDVNRLAYLIREVTSNNKVEWFADKGGVKLSKYVTKPILDHINTDLIRYYNECLANLDTDISEPDKTELRKNMISATSIRKLIKSNQLNDEIIKYIAKFLHLDRKPEIKAITNEANDEILD